MSEAKSGRRSELIRRVKTAKITIVEKKKLFAFFFEDYLLLNYVREKISMDIWNFFYIHNFIVAYIGSFKFG